MAFAPSSRGWSGCGLGWVVADDDGVENRKDLVAGHSDAACVLADRLRIARFVDADGAEPVVGLLHHIAADPPDLVGHLLVADLGRLGGGGLEFAGVGPGTGTTDDIEIHDLLLI